MIIITNKIINVIIVELHLQKINFQDGFCVGWVEATKPNKDEDWCWADYLTYLSETLYF